MKVKNFKVLHDDHGVSHELIRQALEQIESNENFGESLIDFGKITGFSELVEIN